MILFELVQSEQHPAYQDLSIDNLERQYDFLRSIINAAIATNRPMVSTAIIKALNYHAISCLHVNAGEYRPGRVQVGDYVPPEHYRVPELMNAFVNETNHIWTNVDPVALGTYVLWRINNIHPFINGNGRTARALCYFVICVKSGGLLKGDPILPELIRANREEYVALLKAADTAYGGGQSNYLNDLHAFLVRLLDQQMASAIDDSGA